MHDPSRRRGSALTSTINVGGHLSLARDPVSTVTWAAEKGFGSMQIFTSSPGAWKPPVLNSERVERFRQARLDFGIAPLVIHAIYLINLASEDRLLVERSKRSLISALEAGCRLGAAVVVTHLGRHGGRGFEAVAGTVAANLMEVVDSARGEVDLALENSAGSGGILGGDLRELGELIERAGRHERLKLALDTAHLCGWGWDFSDAGSAEQLVSELQTFIGLERLALIHGNDSKVPCGSRKDRHTNIGDGYIGLDGFRHLLAQCELRRVPWILETPNLEQRADDRVKISTLAREATRGRESHES